MKIYYNSKIYIQRTPTSKIIEYSLKNEILNKYETIEELDNNVLNEIIKSKDLYEHPENYFDYYILDKGEAILKSIINKYELPKNIKIPEYIAGYPITTLSRNLFEQTSIESIIMHDDINLIGDSIFCDCYELKNAELSPSIKKINGYSFFNCKSLKSIKIPANLELIEMHAFSYSGMSGSIEFPETLKYISTFAFAGCTFDNITLHQDTMLGPNAFEFDSQLRIHEYTTYANMRHIERE